jgi:hypothetical protein
MKIATEYFGDRIKETTTSTGTGNITLAGAVASFQTFNSGLRVVADGVTKNTYYSVFSSGGSEWEIGIGTISSGASTTLIRSTVLSSSNANQLVNFSAGTKTVVSTVPAQFVQNARSCKDMILTAGETIAVNDLIFIDQNDGKAYEAQANVIAEGVNSIVTGFAMEAATANNSLRVRVMGKVTGFTDLTVGRLQYMSDTAGAITETAPNNVIAVGIATAPNELFISLPSLQRKDFIFGRDFYFCGGFSGAALTVRCDKLATANDTVGASVNVALPNQRGAHGAISSFNLKGYIAGGEILFNNTPVSTSLTIFFADETFQTITTANLSQAREEPCCLSNRNTAGYYIGGHTAVGTSVATADKITFNTDTTTAQTTANATQARSAGAGLTEGFFKGYNVGGFTASNVEVTTSDIFYYANETSVARTSVNLDAAGSHILPMTNLSSTGYLAGGQTGSAVAIATIRKIQFSTDTISTSTATLSAARWGAFGGSNGFVSGYICGGQTGGAYIAASNKFTFGNEVATSVSSLALSQARGRGGSLGDVAC